MKRRSTLIIVAVLLVAALVVFWKTRSGGSTRSVASGGGSATAAKTVAGGGVAPAPRKDPKTIPRASIAGTVTDDGKAPLPHAHVCAGGYTRDFDPELFRDPSCTETDD